MSNEVSAAPSAASDDAAEPKVARADEPRPLVLIAGADDLVCVDDTCLPAGVAPEPPEASAG